MNLDLDLLREEGEQARVGSRLHDQLLHLAELWVGGVADEAADGVEIEIEMEELEFD